MSPWATICPPIPLRRGVPCVNLRTGEEGIVLGTVQDRHGADPLSYVVDTGEAGHPAWSAGRPAPKRWTYADTAPDLDDFEGFGYALRYFGGLEDFGPETMPHSASDGFTGMSRRWFESCIMEADKLTLARALAAASRFTGGEE